MSSSPSPDEQTATAAPSAEATVGSGGDVGADDATMPVPEDAAEHVGAHFGRFVTVGMLGRGGMGVVLSALDPSLDRKVAIKVLHPGLVRRDAARARLQREAQAMARLAHPNVVTVYEVGSAGEHQFIAMELVDGTTLRAWLNQRPRDWRAVLAMFVAAGRGLVAAHAAGLVHRDFKPENVLIGRDGRPRVSDFGLVSAGGTVSSDDVATAETATPAPGLTERGTVMGTPQYMAPEQWRGDEVDARSDQFSFCVALWSGLWGAAPFGTTGASGGDLRAAVLAGKRRAAPGGRDGRGVPRWVEPLLRRGLEVDPDRRWPSLGRLLDELERRAGGRRWVWLAGAGGGVAVAAAIAAVAWPAERGDPCAPPTARAAAVWQQRRAALQARLPTIDPAIGERRFAAAAAVFDRALPAWTDLYVSACRATHVEGRQSDSMLDARMRCLDQWLVSTGDAVTALETATDADTLMDAIRGIALPPLDRCSDASALEADVLLPEAAAQRAEALAIIDEAEALNRDRRRNNGGIDARAAAAVARARTLGNATALARALAVRWRVQVANSDIAAAVATMRELTEVAGRAHDDHEAAVAWSNMGRLTGDYLGQTDEARVMFTAAHMAAARAGDPPLLVFEILSDEAEALAGASPEDAERAVVQLAEARRLLAGLGADQPGSPIAHRLSEVLHSTGKVDWYAGRLDEAVTAVRGSIAVLDRAYGPDMRETASLYLTLCQILQERNDLAAAEDAINEGIRILERYDGQSRGLAIFLGAAAAIIANRGRIDEAISVAERGLVMARAALPAEDPQLSVIQASLGSHYLVAKRLPEALAIYEEVLAAAERRGTTGINIASWWINRAQIEGALGRCEDAILHFRKGAEVGRAVEGEQSHYRGSALRGEGMCLHELGRNAEAITALEASLAFPVPALAAGDEVEVRELLAKLRGQRTNK